MNLPKDMVDDMIVKGARLGPSAIYGDDAATQPDTVKKSKYGNKKVEIGGLKFDSKREAKRWLDLVQLERGGVIRELKRQVRFELHAAGGKKVCAYFADFTFVENGVLVVEDCKGMRTPMYKLKKKWMLAEYGITIRET